MIDQIDRQLRDWVVRILGDATVAFDLRPERSAPRGVVLHLMELVEEPPPRGSKRPPLQLLLRYLVSCWAESAEEAHRLLGTLVFAAMENRDVRVEFAPVASEFWIASAVPPRPCFFLCVPCRVERASESAPPVRVPLVMKTGAISSIEGLVVGPGDIPVMDARVEVVELGLTSRTDFRGRFHFPSIPTESELVLRVKGKGQEIDINAGRAAESKEGLVIRLPQVEV